MDDPTGRGRGLYVGVGVSRYAAGARELPLAVEDVTEIGRLVGDAFTGEPLLNPERGTVQGLLERVPRVLEDGGAVLAVWCGHGVPSANGVLRLPTTETTNTDLGGVAAGDLMTACAQSGANQILLVIDTCYSGAAVVDVAAMAGQILRERPPEGRYVWVGVLAACSPEGTARDGALGKVLRDLLTDGPPDVHTQVSRWSPHQRLVRGDDLCDAVLKNWTSHAQTPEFLSRGSAWFMIPNPRYRPGAPRGVVEHLLRAARGHAFDDEASAFTGRRAEVDAVLAWVMARKPGIRVVTGPPGTGKSAIVGRVVSVTDPIERAHLTSAPGWHGWQHTDPGVGAVDAHVHARALTADGLAERIDGQLAGAASNEAPAVLVPDPSGRGRNAALLVGALQQLAENGDVTVPVIVVDGLDEARGEAFSIADDLLSRLAQFATVIVATRQVPGPTDTASLLDRLAPGGPDIDLGDPEVAARGVTDLSEYLIRRLQDVSPVMNAESVADQFVSTISGGQPFLLARIVADQLRAHPVDTHDSAWHGRVATTFAAAFDADLAQVSPPTHRPLPEAITPAAWARRLLGALTWAFGAGFPHEEWLAAAQAMSPAVSLTGQDIDWVLTQGGRYVVQDGEDGVAVYRVAHQSVADLLRPPFVGTADTQFDLSGLPLTAALAGRYRRLLRAGLPAREPGYLWRHFWRHAAAAGPQGLTILRELARGDGALAADVALACLRISDQLRFWGRRDEALPPTLEAVTTYRDLAAANPASLPDLAMSLTSLGVRYSEVGRREEALPPTLEAVTTYRDLAAANPAFLPGLAMSLTSLGVRYSEVGRRDEALPPTLEAVTTYRDLAAANPAFLPDLAMSLTSLGVRYREVGRRDEALLRTLEAVTLLRDLAAANPAFLPDLAGALNNLGICYREVGRREEALPPTLEAVTTYRDLAAANPAFLPDLAMSLTNLGAGYNELGRREEALPPTLEAVTLRRALAAANPAFLPNLAMSLNNLGAGYSKVGRREEALPPTLEAVTTYRDLAAANPAFLPDLAMSLTNLGVRYNELGRRDEALPPTLEAVTTYRDLAAANPAFLPNLAGALTNLGNCYREVGRPDEALPPTLEAVTTYRDLAAANPAFLPDLAMSLTNLGAGYNELGRREEALPPTLEAVTTYRDLAAANPAFLPDLAMSLNNLGAGYREVGRRDEALPPTLEAVTLRRALAAANPAFLPNLAMSLSNLGAGYREVGRRDEALPPTLEAVTLLRDLAAANPAFLPDLAMSLTNLGNCYREVGRRDEALPPTLEAVTLRRDLAAANPAFLPDLAGALKNLAQLHEAAGDPVGADDAWEKVIGQLPAASRSVLLLFRCAGATAGDRRSIAWIIRALADTEGDGPAEAAMHEQARRHRHPDPDGFDSAWYALQGEGPPSWCLVEGEALSQARAWTGTTTFEDEAAYLQGHPGLLESSAAPAIEETLIALPAEEATRYRLLLQEARDGSVAAAYRPLLLTTLAARFVAADPDGRRSLLAEQAQDLLSEDVAALLGSWSQAHAGPDSAAAEEAGALLDLVRAGHGEEALAALAASALFTASLHQAATRADAQQVVSMLATLAWAHAQRRQDLALGAAASLYLGVAAALDGDLDTAAFLLQEARAADPTQRDGCLAMLADLVPTHPALAPLIPALLAPPLSPPDHGTVPPSHPDSHHDDGQEIP